MLSNLVPVGPADIIAHVAVLIDTRLENGAKRPAKDGGILRWIEAENVFIESY